MDSIRETDPADRAELARDIADRAIDRWNRALAERAEAYRLMGDRAELEPWADLTTRAAIDAGRLLLRAILAHDPSYTRGYKAECRRWAPRALRSQRKLYIAFPDPGRDEGLDGIPEDLDGPDLMMLVVLDEANIVDVERAEGGKLAS